MKSQGRTSALNFLADFQRPELGHHWHIQRRCIGGPVGILARIGRIFLARFALRQIGRIRHAVDAPGRELARPHSQPPKISTPRITSTTSRPPPGA